MATASLSASTTESQKGRICAACQQTMLTADGQPRTAPSVHCCKNCKADLHSYIVCEAVWMPLDNAYFCSSSCIRNHNSKQLATVNAGKPLEERILLGSGDSFSKFVCDAQVFPVRHHPRDEVAIDGTSFDKADADASGTSEASKQPGSNALVPYEVDQPAAKPTADNGNVEEESESEAEEPDKPDLEDEVGGEREGISDHLLAMLKEGSRVQMAFKQSDTDEHGSWFGGLVGCTRLCQPVAKSVVTIGYDDGEMIYYYLGALQVGASLSHACASSQNR